MYPPVTTLSLNTRTAKQRNQSNLHMLHEHVGFCNSASFTRLLYDVLVSATGDNILNILDARADVQMSSEDAEAGVAIRPSGRKVSSDYLIY